MCEEKIIRMRRKLLVYQNEPYGPLYPYNMEIPPILPVVKTREKVKDLIGRRSRRM